MQRIPSLFLRDPSNGLVTSELDPQNNWVAEGRGVATRKWDGVPCLIDNEYIFYRGAYAPGDIEPPDDFEVEETLPNGDRFGWIVVKQNAASDAAYTRTIYAYHKAPGVVIAPGTYEMCGPGIKGNREGLDHPWLYRHDGMVMLTAPRDYDSLIWYLNQHHIEGLIWRYGPFSAQITRKDVGLPWPQSR